MKNIFLVLIRFYQRTKFFHQPIMKQLFLSDANCRFKPTCSEYTYEAVKKYGAIKGMRLGVRRIVRCNPWNKGGYDPVE